jgi:hypothetical protein
MMEELCRGILFATSKIDEALATLGGPFDIVVELEGFMMGDDPMTAVSFSGDEHGGRIAAKYGLVA